MIGILAQKILKLIMPQMIEHFVGIFKSDRVLDYMELPNDADRRIDKLEEQIKLIIEDQYPPAIDLKEWEDVKETIKKIKNKRVFKSLNA